MKPKLRMLLIGACLGNLAMTMPAGAQPNDSNVSFDAGALMPKKAKPTLPELRAQPLAWPRLDPGAVVCRSEEDLAKLGARRHGQHVDGPIDCQIVRAATAISIMQRNGPGRTEVKASDPRAADWSGWTDAWLPEKGNVGTTSVSR